MPDETGTVDPAGAVATEPTPETGQEPPQSPEQGQAEQPQEPDWLAQMNERMDQMRDEFGFAAQQPEEQGPPAEQPEYGNEFEEGGEDPYAEARTLIGEVVKQELQPLIEQQTQQRFEDAAADLAEEYPDLQRQEVAGPVVNMTSQFGHRLAQAIGGRDSKGIEQARKAIFNDPVFVDLTKLIYMASRAEAAAASEGSDGESGNREIQLETGGASAPQSPSPSPEDEFKAGILEAERSASLFG